MRLALLLKTYKEIINSKKREEGKEEDENEDEEDGEDDGGEDDDEDEGKSLKMIDGMKEDLTFVPQLKIFSNHMIERHRYV